MTTPTPLPPCINAAAPIRVCDIGGWTDTWFAGHGAVFNIAVRPCVEVQVFPLEQPPAGGRVLIAAENYGDTYAIDPQSGAYRQHPLLEAAVASVPLPRDLALRVNLYSPTPPGASTGTSAAVCVALVGALAALAGTRLGPAEAARLAHAVETERLGQQSGIQDQLASAYGGVGYIEMDRYPHATVTPVPLPDRLRWELEQRLALVYIGRPHSSSAVHQQVIASLGPNAQADPRLQRLRELARAAHAAVCAGDLAELGRIMDENTAAQRALHPALVCAAFEDIIDVARGFGVLGCKVNGAGGDGGSVTLLTDGHGARKRQLLAALAARGYHHLPVALSGEGLRVW